MKKNNTVEKTVQDAQNITKALKESTMSSLKSIMESAINQVIQEGDDEDEEPEEVVDDNFEKGKDVETDDKDTKSEDNPTDDKTEDGEDADDDAKDSEDADDEWSDMEEFKVGDNDYDLTSADDDMALKVYNKLGDDDKIILKKEDDKTYSVEDQETGAEFTIELGDDVATDDLSDEGGDEFDITFDGEEPVGDGEEVEYDLEMGDDEDDGLDELDEEENLFVKGYQKGDVIKGLSMNEPANGSTTYSMDGGVPKGTERPYEKGAGDGKPFEKKVNECGDVVVDGGQQELDEDGSGLNTKHSTKKNTNHINRSAQNQRHVSTDGDYQALKETARKVYEKAKQIQEENKQYQQCIKEIKNSLKEAAVLNVNLAQVVRLLSENTTTENEKKSIVKRFSNVKTIKEGKDLYNTIKMELNENKKSSVVLEGAVSVTPNKTQINETTIYTASRQSNPALDLMDRMDNLYKH